MVVWVANRERPAKNMPRVLNKEGNLGLFDTENTSLWSVNMSIKCWRPKLLDSGNFKMLGHDNNSKIIWQSFDYPVDTWLPRMKFGGHQKLVSWKNSMDPAPGLYSLQLDPSGAEQFVLTWNDSVKYWESGSWDGQIFSEVPKMIDRDYYSLTIENTNFGMYFSYKLLKGISRFLQIKSGGIQEFSIFNGTKWTLVGTHPRDQCTVYGFCGAYGSCNSDNIQFCSCVDGFSPTDEHAWNSQDWWSSGYVRERSLNCDTKYGSTDKFIKPGVMFPDDSAWSYPAPTKEVCQKA